MLNANHLAYVLLDTAFGMVGIIWHQAESDVRVERVLLPAPSADVEHRISQYCPTASPGTCLVVADLCARIRAFLRGQPVPFDVCQLNLDLCSHFQRRVLVAEHGIPRG